MLEAKRTGGKSGVLIVGGGSPKNFMLQTEPQIQEVLGIDERGHDYFLQITDARPDTGGLSGATPAEAVSWGKIDPDQLPGTVVFYVDNSIALPLLTAYAMASGTPTGPLKRLYRPARGDDGAAGRGIPGGARVPGRAGGGIARAHASGRRGSRDGGAAVTPPSRAPTGLWYALGLLALINLLNYLDRNVIFALFEPIKRDLALTDTQLGWLGSAYIFVFSVAALPFGVLSDLRSRRAVIAGRRDGLERVHLPERAGQQLLAAVHLPRRWSAWARRRSARPRRRWWRTTSRRAAAPWPWASSPRASRSAVCSACCWAAYLEGSTAGGSRSWWSGCRGSSARSWSRG